MDPSPYETVYLWPGLRRQLFVDLANAPTIHTGEWQAMNTSGSTLHTTHEMEDVTIVVPRVPSPIFGQSIAVKEVREVVPGADYDWADEHFGERVSGLPHNPAPSHVRWPYAVGGNLAHMHVPAERGDMTPSTPYAKLQFDHTYPERFWPKHAGHYHPMDHEVLDDLCGGHSGIRFEYGDLGDVIKLLVHNPLTRQAYLPVWFPEDTGAAVPKGEYDPRRDGDWGSIRVPCTLGYHFMVRNGRMSMRYYMRSCDMYRHLDNDIYLAARLLQWVVARVQQEQGHMPHCPHWGELVPGRLVMHIASLHMFTPDVAKMAKKVQL